MADGLVGLGISQIWAPAFALVVLVVALARARVLLRAGLIVAFALSYFLLVGLADGSGSRLPDGPVVLALTLAAIPLASAAVAVLLIRHVESYGLLRRAWVFLLEALVRAARGDDPTVPQPVLCGVCGGDADRDDHRRGTASDTSQQND